MIVEDQRFENIKILKNSRFLQNEWLILAVLIVFNFSSNFTLKSGGMGNFFCSECFSKEKPAAKIV